MNIIRNESKTDDDVTLKGGGRKKNDEIYDVVEGSRGSPIYKQECLPLCKKYCNIYNSRATSVPKE